MDRAATEAAHGVSTTACDGTLDDKRKKGSGRNSNHHTAISKPVETVGKPEQTAS